MAKSTGKGTVVALAATRRDRDWPSDAGLRCPAALIDCLHWVKPLEKAIPDTLIAK
jgi:hypothetical protein